MITVDPDDLVTISDIAARLQMKRNRVQMWDTRRETTEFPQPIIVTPGGTRLWSWKDVQTWMQS